MRITGQTRVAGVVGRPITHSLSPILHNAWIAAAGLDAVYVPFTVADQRFEAFVEGMREASICGVNVSLPYKGRALVLADSATERALSAGAANVLVFQADGQTLADNTDGLGLLSAFASQAPDFDPSEAPVVIFGAGGGAQGAAAAFLSAGCSDVRVINRNPDRALSLAAELGDRVRGYGFHQAEEALARAGAIINATSAALFDPDFVLPIETAPQKAVVMDMVYKPLMTSVLRDAARRGHPIVDGLEMLIGQARPAFNAFFGQDPPASVPVRNLALAALEAQP